MNNEILFSERQRFTQWWLWLMLFGINGFFLYGFFIQVLGGQPFGSDLLSDSVLIIATGLTILLTLLFSSFRLDTQIKQDGIYVRFFPLHINWKHYTWDSLNKSYVRKYSAIMEFGGLGLRIGLLGKSSAYCVSGNKGLQLEFETKQILIGTNKSDEITETLTKIGHYKQ